MMVELVGAGGLTYQQYTFSIRLSVFLLKADG